MGGQLLYAVQVPTVSPGHLARRAEQARCQWISWEPKGGMKADSYREPHPRLDSGRGFGKTTRPGCPDSSNLSISILVHGDSGARTFSAT